MTKELKAVRDALERLIRCGQKQGFNDGYVTEMDNAHKALATLDSIMADGGCDWSGLDKILRGMRARNEQGSLELTNWIADNREEKPLDMAGDVNNPLFTGLDMICHGLFIGREKDIRRHAAECLKSAGYDNHNIRAALNDTAAPKHGGEV